jgi:glycerol dehydrogenase
MNASFVFHHMACKKGERFMPTKIIITPNKYVQGPDELKNLSTYLEGHGQKAFIIAGKRTFGVTKDTLSESFSQSDIEYVSELFSGECTASEIDRLKSIAERERCDIIIGIGGGKAIDTAKAVAYYMHMPAIVVPTIVSTDAPTSALSVLYTEKGVFDRILNFPSNPSMVIVDTTIIANAPVRLFVSGMGDALATYFEARASAKANATTMAGGKASLAALALARLCYDTLLSDGLKAKLAIERNVCNQAVENIVEANTYLSGIGFESGGLAAAHPIHNGFTILESCHDLYHGEKVAFGTLAQLVLENAPRAEIKEVIDFCRSVGLPVTLKDLHADQATEKELRAVAKKAIAPEESIHNMPFEVTEEDVYSAILVADRLGSSL